MSTRPSLPKPLPRWPFYLGDVAFLLLALITLASADSPPGLGHIILATICVVVGIGLLIVPYLIEYDAKVRFAEAQASDMVETQMRRFGQMTEQLSNVVSRTQSIEEQVGQALGTLEEIADKLSSQADDVAQLLSKSGQSGGERDLQPVLEHNDKRLAALEKQIAALASALSQAGKTDRETHAGTANALAKLTDRVESLATRLAETSTTPPAAARTAAASPKSSDSDAADAAPADPAPEATDPRPTTPPAAAAKKPQQGKKEEAAPKASASRQAETAPPAGKTPPEEAPEAPVEAQEKTNPAESTATPEEPRSTPKRKSTPRKAVSESLELPLDGVSPTASSKRRESGPATSLVATAYIGIGNKLYIRGEGPGLSWDEGVPMQFLAIGKWGWTSTEVDGQVVCRVYRNDETPMLDEDIIIPAGTKVEVTPRF